MTGAAALSLRGVSKRFGSLQANSKISLELRQGEILALLGENGAGKTTLTSIIFGSYVADEGEIEVFGQPLRQGSTRAALGAGIGMVQQHFALADNLSVFDNILIGTEPLLNWRRSSSTARQKIAKLAKQCGFALNLDAMVHSLSVGERQKVEILKVLYRDARILVLDEPTAVLTPQEAGALFDTLRRLVADGLSIILISHKLQEILEVSNRICVLRHGKLVHECDTATAKAGELAQAMVGREVIRKFKRSLERGPPLLQLADVRLSARSQAVVSLALHEHEILGITGVAGNGQQELADLLCGLTRPAGGMLELFGKEDLPRAVDMASMGVARIPADRGQVGVNGDMTVAENLASSNYARFCQWGFLDRAALARNASSLMADYDVRCDSPSQEARLLSGGNMQKLILARELSGEPRLIIANQPTRGLDVGAISGVHRLLLEACERGAGVLLITEDLEELFALVDKVAVMFKGELGDFFPAADLDIAQVGLMMGGSSSLHAA